MNIGPIVRGLLGENRAGQPKELELKMGQVIRGVVLSVSDNGHEAVVQVQGVQLRAVLETPLQKGQTALLQVQPPGKDGMAVLKPLNLTSAASLTDQSLAEMLDSFGIENTTENREMLKLMQAQGIPLTKDQASVLQQSLASRPKGVPLEQWVESAAIAFHRGLPITAASVSGLNQAVFGTSVQDLLSTLGDQVASLLSELPDLESVARSSSGSSASSTAGLNSANSAAAQSNNPEGSSNPDSIGPSRSGQTGATAAAIPSKGSELLLKIQGLLEELRNLGSQSAASPSATANTLSATGMNETVNGQGMGSLGSLAVENGNGAGLDNYETVLSGSSSTNRSSNGAVSQVMDGAANGGSGLNDAEPEADGSVVNPAKAAASGPAASTGPAAQRAADPAGTSSGAAASAPEEPGAAPSAAAPRGTGEEPAASSPARTHAAEPWVARVLKLLGAEHEQQTARTVTLGASPARAASAAAGGAAAPSGEVPAGSVPQAAPGEPAAPARSGAATALPGTAVPAGQHERHAAVAGPAALPEVPAAAAEPAAAIRETLKSVLMQVLDSSDLPPQLQDTAKQLVNQLTGQQLLMNTDRTAPFAQMTMFLPFTGPDGDQTASVHIQSRRGRRGELDASNCRLWFDLQMKHLGQVMVDVQVADKKVILKIHSEQEAVGAFIENRQEEIKDAVEAAGYRLLSLKAEPMDTSSKRQGADSVPPLYVPPAYKGVDFRI
ncbi:flagellar hook-length control protein FliK [Paenibacillus sp. SN-8-1]|uniref:flagellar hook-length control protein FliK n=1 Tax=Paenibacillus sp. SN-8-1 TaxID=3435409 RepID=UPI003D9A4181